MMHPTRRRQTKECVMDWIDVHLGDPRIEDGWMRQWAVLQDEVSPFLPNTTPCARFIYRHSTLTLMIFPRTI